MNCGKNAVDMERPGKVTVQVDANNFMFPPIIAYSQAFNIVSFCTYFNFFNLAFPKRDTKFSLKLQKNSSKLKGYTKKTKFLYGPYLRIFTPGSAQCIYN